MADDAGARAGPQGQLRAAVAKSVAAARVTLAVHNGFQRLRSISSRLAFAAMVRIHLVPVIVLVRASLPTINAAERVP
jgi:hypothetical protein